MAISLLIALLALPLAELAVFVWVAAHTGFLATLGLVIVTSLAGVALIRHAGLSQLARMRAMASEESVGAWHVELSGAGVLLAAILLVVPGFITDLAAVLLLIGPLRRTLANLIARAFGLAPAARQDGQRDGQQDGVVDLAPQEWRREPEPRLTRKTGVDSKNGSDLP